MCTSKLFRTALVAACLLSPLALAQRFIQSTEHSIGASLPPPPTDSSPAGLADLQTVLQVQAERTPEQVSRAKRVEKHTPFLMGSAVMGPWFTESNLPRTAEIMRLVWKQTSQETSLLKRKWMRERPPARNERVRPCVKIPADSSYPSGHSTNATVWAAVFSAAFPEQAEAFSAQAHETMWARVLGGAHFPSDTQAGKLLGEEIAKAMLASPEMKAALEEIRAEVSAWKNQASKTE